jgi:hypothetical protein
MDGIDLTPDAMPLFMRIPVMARETAQAAETASRELSGFFGQAFRAYGDSMKVAMNAQEETVRFWGEAAGKANTMSSLAGELIPAAQKNTDEYLRLLESSYRRGAELLKKAVPPQDGGDAINMQKHAQNWWEACLEVARDNAQEWASTNLRVAQSSAEIFKKGAHAQKAAMGK